MCGDACGANAGCCNNLCTALNTLSNCGGCGTLCAAGSGCCGGTCSSLATVQSCGACGNVCPGQTNTSDALCTNATCSMTCQGENYDVDKNPANGCEKAHPGTYHSIGGAYYAGSQDCGDGLNGTISGYIYSDARTHNPSIQSFNKTVGSAPDVYQVYATGSGGCYNNYGYTVTTTGGAAGTSCYRFTFDTDTITSTVTMSGSDSKSASDDCSVVDLTCDYSNGSYIYITMEKICSLPVQEAVHYSIGFHL